jgi:hypothetical protein
VADYRDLGPTQLLTAVLDTMGQNPFGRGNWMITATQKDLNCYVAQAEVYQIAIDGPVGSSMKMYRNTRPWNFVIQGWSNYDDPMQPLYVRPGDSVFLYWNISIPPAPTAVLWLRYDIALPENQQVR